MKVTKDSIMGDILREDNQTAQFFFAIGMHCIGCPSAQAETIEEACMVHGLEYKELVDQLNEYFAKKESK